MIVYKLTFASGKSYIGQTTRTLHTRLMQHRQSTRNNSQLAVHCAWRAHGDPSISVLIECGSQQELHDAERRLIAEHDTLSPNGYNVSHGGDTAPSCSPEVAEKIRQKATGRKKSAEANQRASEIAKQKWADPEYRAKVSSSLKASFASAEFKEKQSERMKARWKQKKSDGWVMPQEQRDSLAARPIDDEWRKNMSEAAKKRIRTPVKEETCVKLSGNAKAQHANRTPEQKAAIAEKIRQSNKARYAAMTPEQYEAFCELRKRSGQVQRANRLAAITQSPDNPAS